MSDISEILTRPAAALSDAELFGRIAYKIRRKYAFEITEAQACEAARNLLGFHKTLVDMNERKSHSAKNNGGFHEQEDHTDG
jgi:hypothetical protein